MNWIYTNWIYIESVVLVIFVIFQVRYFLSTRESIINFKNSFPAFKFSKEDITEEGAGTESFRKLSISNPINDTFKKIVDETNEYLKNNIGTADFNIIKSIAEGISDSEENAVASTVAIPLYLGLMGTFAGVILGLLNILMNSTGLLEGNNTATAIRGLLLGVCIAMMASFMGLLLTTSNNVFALKNAISERNIRKTNYYNFLYAYLLPNLDNSLYSALSMLKSNIYEFNDIFSNNLTLFDTSLKGNINTLATAVSGMSGQIEAINENTKLQIEFLNRLKKIDYNKVAQANLDVLEKIEHVGPLLIQFIQEQKSLNENITETNQFISKVGALFDRISTFEESINQLGRDIQQSELVGGDIISYVKKHLASITEKEELIRIYTSKSNAEVKDHLEKGLIRIQEVKRKIQSEFERAFDFEVQSSLMQNLTFLKSINESIDGLRNDFQEMIKLEVPPEPAPVVTNSEPRPSTATGIIPAGTPVDAYSETTNKETAKSPDAATWISLSPANETTTHGTPINETPSEGNDEMVEPEYPAPKNNGQTPNMDKINSFTVKRSFFDKIFGRPGTKN
jgi:hypothetical protein